MHLAGTVQGGVYQDLRERCASELSKLDFDLHPIGGVVPLLEGYRYADIAEVIIASKKGLNPARPVHLFGAGHPMVFPMAALLGCDMFDSASYAKYAREERLMYSSGTRFLNDLHDLACHCPACSKTSIQELRKMDKVDKTRILAEHNLHVCLREIKTVKNQWIALASDPDAPYDRVIDLDLGRLVPRVAKPHSPDNIATVNGRCGHEGGPGDGRVVHEFVIPGPDARGVVAEGTARAIPT